MTTYTEIDAGSIDTLAVYADAAATTTLVETLTSSDVGVGLYEATAALTYTSYSIGTVYYLKVTYTPSGDTQRTQIFPFYVLPQGQAAGASAITTTTCSDGAHLEPPTLLLRVGRHAYRESDFENGLYATQHRFVQTLPLPASKSGEQIHFLISSARAGAPVSLLFLTLNGELTNKFSGGEVPQATTMTVPIAGGQQGGYRSSSVTNQHYLRQSRNISVHNDIPRTRPGYKIQRQLTQTAAAYLERIPVNGADGTLRSAIWMNTAIYEDKTTPSSAETGLTGPYAATTNNIPQHQFIRDRTIVVDGTVHRLLYYDTVAAALESKAPLADPGTPTVTSATGSSGTLGAAAGTYFVRIRWRDNDTGTESGPSQRGSTAASQVIDATNDTIDVTRVSPPDRATHWQVQISTLDTPANYEISYDPTVSVGGATAVDGAVGSGWILKATTQVFIENVPTSSDRFEYRSMGASTLYRHANPPTGAAHVTHYRGRAFFASDTDTWLVWSESDNIEHHYADESDPNTGFNTVSGESLVDTVLSPCTALAATENQLLFFMETGIVVYEGSFVLSIDSNTGIPGRRDYRANILAQNSVGAIAPSVGVVDQDLYFFSQDGPKVYAGGAILDLDTEGLRADWECRDPVYEHRYVIGYSPDLKSVLFSWVSKNTAITGYPDITCAWSVMKRQWSPPWDLYVSSWTLGRLIDIDGTTNLKTQLIFGGPYGAMNQFGFGYGDGEDGSDTDADDLLSTSDTTTTVTVTGKTWSTGPDEWKSKSVVLTDRTTGQRYYRVIKSNSPDALTWEGALTDAGGGWKINIGGIRSQIHWAVMSPGSPFVPRRLAAHLGDILSTDT